MTGPADRSSPLRAASDELGRLLRTEHSPPSVLEGSVGLLAEIADARTEDRWPGYLPAVLERVPLPRPSADPAGGDHG
jgi:hypothetical protein